MIKKLLPIFLTFVFVIPFVSSCGETQKDPTQTGSSSSYIPHSEGAVLGGTKYAQNKDGLDYADDNNWFYKPKNNDKTGSLDLFIVPPSFVGDAKKDKYIDVSDKDYNDKAKEWIETVIKPVFNHLNINVYIPKYRAWNNEMFYKASGYKEAYLTLEETPKNDIYNAFDYYVSKLLKPELRGEDYFTIYGEDQGGALAGLLVSDFATNYLKKNTVYRMKGAYIPGWSFSSTLYNNSPFEVGKSMPKIGDFKGQVFSWNLATKEEVNSDLAPFSWGDQTSKAFNIATWSKTNVVTSKGTKGQVVLNEKLIDQKPMDLYPQLGKGFGKNTAFISSYIREAYKKAYKEYGVTENNTYNINLQ